VHAAEAAPFSLVSRPLGQRYRLVRELARGNMGSVWLAELLGESVQVAIKRSHRQPEGGTLPCEDPTWAPARLLVEACLTRRVQCPHVVRVLDYGVDADEPYMVMELLRGESLAARLHRLGPLAPAAATALLLQVAKGIEHVHAAGVIHRDLKPENIFIVGDAASSGVAKLVDFGVAKPLVSGEAGLDTLMVGTPQYMSPEQARGSSMLDQRTDVWSFGVVAFECLLGFPPFSADNLAELMLAICSRPLPVPSAQGRVPAGFDAWFRRACARNPDERFASAREAAAAFRASAARSSASPAAMATAMRRWFSRTPKSGRRHSTREREAHHPGAPD
jgi:serine/threonine-protein kinase